MFQSSASATLSRKEDIELDVKKTKEFSMFGYGDSSTVDLSPKKISLFSPYSKMFEESRIQSTNTSYQDLPVYKNGKLESNFWIKVLLIKGYKTVKGVTILGESMHSEINLNLQDLDSNNFRSFDASFMSLKSPGMNSKDMQSISKNDESKMSENKLFDSYSDEIKKTIEENQKFLTSSKINDKIPSFSDIKEKYASSLNSTTSKLTNVTGFIPKSTYSDKDNYRNIQTEPKSKSTNSTDELSLRFFKIEFSDKF